MKKLIQVFSLLGLLVLFTSVSALAQGGYGSDVEIPFAFNVGDRSYEAGHYIVKVNKVAAGQITLSIRDTKTDETQLVLLSERGDAPSKEMKLVFETIGDQRFLSKVLTPNHAFALAKPKKSREADKAQKASSNEVSVSDLF